MLIGHRAALEIDRRIAAWIAEADMAIEEVADGIVPLRGDARLLADDVAIVERRVDDAPI